MLALRTVGIATKPRTPPPLCPSPVYLKQIVSNIIKEANREDVTELFNTYGQIKNVNLIFKRETGRPRSIGFFTFSDYQHGASSIQTLNGTDVKGRTIRVAETHPPPPKSNPL
eukprot:TRINITY_DN19541_c2854_g1_i1.p1 TRINITY_DN19541_c2854_g1~~TRINITY_DN19541_c2854_g1_i1.p1  ORF type:complete len:113 (-),score=2.68 TRINITY_DN19541_c2854_g1_i1:58-396(-)